MNTIFEFAQSVLQSGCIEEKLRLTRQAGALRDQGLLTIESIGEPRPIDRVRFPEKPRLVSPRDLPRRSLATLTGRIALLHSLAHIEFYAIHLAWDIIIRFRGMRDAYYLDWLQVAVEEALHFELLRARLRDLGAEYGDLPAHSGLWDVAVDTAGDLLARLALVPRTLEARGLDVTPGMISRLLGAGDTESAAVLERILHDEIGHVKTGNYWFGVVCLHRNLDSQEAYFSLLERHMKGRIRGPINHDLRLEAGFSASDLARLQKMQG